MNTKKVTFLIKSAYTATIFFKVGYPTQKQTGDLLKIAPSNPLLLKDSRGALLHSYKIAKNIYFALLRGTDSKGFKGINLSKN